jgi:hypothetical protein
VVCSLAAWLRYDPRRMPVSRSTRFPAWFPAPAVLIAIVVLVSCRTVPAPRPAASAVAPTVIMLSLDGWRWDYHTKASLPAVRRLIDGGVRAEGLIPGFPSKTFPNHYSIVTGLYPGHHGVIGNSMVDPSISGRFMLGDREQVGNAAWWGGEPLWTTVIRQGRPRRPPPRVARSARRPAARAAADLLQRRR